MRDRVGAGLQVARRPDDAGARPRRLRARAARRWPAGWSAADAGGPGAVRRAPAHAGATAERRPWCAACGPRASGGCVADWDAGPGPARRRADGRRRAHRRRRWPTRRSRRAYRRVRRAAAAPITAELAGRGPARPAQAVQGAALRAGGLRPGHRRRRIRKQRGRRPQGAAGRARPVPGHRGAAPGAAQLRRGDDGRRHARARRCWRWASSSATSTPSRTGPAAEFDAAFATFARPGRRSSACAARSEVGR